MSDQDHSLSIHMAALSDRGLSEKRPLNEDAYLVDSERRIFAVADGVGGAQAGEVASQTAMDVLNEAFKHKVDGADLEDQMELAIQRANNSIFKMAREHPDLATMATTIVALHLDGNIATYGHVGDSRLYRLTPDGVLHRETRDHSVVEEEVRAGRMTPAQAANHPSRNVISRALGVEDNVEVDMNTISVEDGTTFLLCTDGITRHVGDKEITDLLSTGLSPQSICDELKRRCYERGAEDNLTAVVVRVGDSGNFHPEDDERTLTTPRPDFVNPGTNGGQTAIDSNFSQTTLLSPAMLPSTEGQCTENSRASVDEAPRQPPLGTEAQQETIRRKGPSFFGTLLRALGLMVLFLGAAAAAFYVGTLYERRADQRRAAVVASSFPVGEPAIQNDFLRKRDEVDRDPVGMTNIMANENGGRPLDSSDPEFLYLYGRALMLSGNQDAALRAFTRSVDNIGQAPGSTRSAIGIEARMARAAAALKTSDPVEMQTAAKCLDEVIQTTDQTRQVPAGNNGGVISPGGEASSGDASARP